MPLRIDMTFQGIILAARWRTAAELQHMSPDDQRNTLIVELSQHTNQAVAYFQGCNDEMLIGKGATVVFLREAGIRDDEALKTMSDDDERNTLIVENNHHTDHSIAQLQIMAGL